ncbi:tyrosine-type recombinase/integrase [uncultured Ruminococcus sp.]|uniref:tyrosine-type recombinase/integrase n=1 Tax=uncultured Ruminococcus sp. TaxID=165186 RepID=UPI00260DEB54|nr:tyrosine-type recombinase/integrase [uncultured Ruminococcus sp.]
MPKWSRKRQNKDGTFSYTFRVYRGYTTEGERLKPYVHTWKSPVNLTERQADKEAERQALRFEEQCKTGLAGNATRITLAEFVPVYLEQKKPALSPTTYDYYCRAIELKILPALGHFKLQDIKPVHVQAFIQQLCNVDKMNRNRTETGQHLSPATVRRNLTILQSIMKLAIKRRILTENPARAELLDIPKVTAPKIDIFTKQEAAAMLEALEGEPLQFQVLIQLAIITGARRGELVALKFSDIDRQSNKITIERAAIKRTGQPPEIKPPKDYEVRTVAVSPQCIELIDRLEQEKRLQRRTLGTYWHEGGWLFTQDNGEMMNPQTPTKQFSKFLKRHGFQHRKFHALRHTSATLLLYGGVSLKQVQGRLGHGDIETTNKYLHCLAEADEEAACVLQDMLLTCSKHPKDAGEQAEQKQA